MNVDSATVDPHTLKEFMNRFDSEPVNMDGLKIMFILILYLLKSIFHHL